MPRNRKADPDAKKTPSRRRWWRLGAALTLVAVAAYLGYLNYLISARFDGGAWALPSRVYARALELYPDLAIARDDLRHELELSNYLAVASPPSPGQYRLRGESIELHSRAFGFADGAQPARRVQVFFDAARVAALIDSDSGQSLALFRLPPLILGSYYPDTDEDRLLLAADEVPPRLVATLIAVEDRSFYDHQGISPRAIGRALLANIEAGAVLQGGSTLTQQLAKNLFLTPERSLVRKFNEACMALLLELRLSKREILTAYVNEVFLLQQNRIAIHGFARASRMLFRRSVEHLEAEHIALLVGIVKGPGRYNPFTRPEAARQRRDLVLDIMLAEGVIDADEHAGARAAPLGIVARLPGVNPFPAYLDLVKRQLQSGYPAADLAQRGLEIFTAFDPLVQRNLEQGLERGLARFAEAELQAAVVIADYPSGDVRALVGDRATDYPGFNRALMAQRPIGSLIKPLLLYGLLEAGHTLASPVDDEPIRIRQSNGQIWEPRNFDREVHGRMTLYQAFIHSYNLPFVHFGVAGGLERLAHNLDRLQLLKHDVIYPSMLLGTTAMSPFEVAQLFQVIANDGYFTPLTTIRQVSDSAGRVLERVPLDSFKLFDQARMIQVQRAMIGATENGTARYLARRFAGVRLAGKTGTTDDARDSWFAGFGRRLLAVVWLGRDDNAPIRLSGSSGALRVWADIMQRQGIEAFSLSRDPGLAWRPVHPLDGGITRRDCANSVLLPFPRERVPRSKSACP